MEGMDLHALFRTSTSRALLNGQPNENFKHKRGVRQGDHLSPMLFILAIDSLQKLLDLSTQNGVLTLDNTSNGQIGTSLYANDAAIFWNLVRDELERRINASCLLLVRCQGSSQILTRALYIQ